MLYYIIEQTNYVLLIWQKEKGRARLYIFVTRTSRKMLFVMVNFMFRLDLPR